MGRIQIMSDALASQVAAGEVVERPASVVKELVENALDAGAGNIEVRVDRGGVSLIRVVDDGHGMGRDDALMALERHATSKIATKEDLERITTLGFRGEALPSIASVSRFRMATREAGALSGTEVVVEGGKLRDVREYGGAPGTEMEVRSLFFNIPARRKFLRAESTEFSHVEQQVRLQAIAHPGIRFTLVHGSRTCFQLPAASEVAERVRGLAGDELASCLVPVPEVERRGVRVSGYVGRPGTGRPTRSLQMVFLNRRPVESPAVSAALREAYRGALPSGRYPVTFLFLDVDPREVDVNVHPAKREVRFHDGRAVYDTVLEAVGEALLSRVGGALGTRRIVGGSGMGRAEVGAGTQQGGAGLAAGVVDVERPALTSEAEQRELRGDWNPLAEAARGVGAPRVEVLPGDFGAPENCGDGDGEGTGDEIDEADGGEAVDGAAEFRFIGGMARGFALLESAEGLVILDRRAARERVVYEDARRRMAGEGVASQRLLVPITAELPPRDFDLLIQNREALGRLGFEIEAFGARTVKVEAVPGFLRCDDPVELVSALVDEMRGASASGRGMRLADEALAASVCRKSGWEDGKPADEDGVRVLLDRLFRCDLPYCCPRGNPTLIQMGHAELDRKFGRGG